MSKPRLLVVGPVPPPVHGTAAYVRMLLDATALAADWDVLHLDTSDRRSLDNLGRFDVTNVRLAFAHVGSLAQRVRQEGVRVVWIPVSQNAPAYLRDALFIHGAHAGGARVVTHLHGGWFREFYDRAAPPVRWLVRTSSARVDRAWVLGERLRAVYRGLIPEDRVRVVANGVADPVGAFDRSARPPGPPTILHLGQLSVAKGVLDLIEAVRRLRATNSDLRLILAGPWATREDEARVRSAISDPVLTGAVELAGVVTGAAKRELLVRADVFVLATRYAFEGQPLAILEAMAAGLPVVATARGAIPDTVEDGATGLLVPEGDVGALTSTLGRLLDDPALRALLGSTGRARWARDFTAERGIARVVDALAELRDGISPAPGAR